MKTLGIFIATPGRRSLWRTLHSIAYQGAPVEDVLVVGDGYHKATAALVDVAKDVLKLPVRYIATEKTRDWGHSQQNYALQHVRGDYLIYQDDDDIFVPRALTEGEVTWACDLRRGDIGGPVIATVLLERDEDHDRYFAMIDTRLPDITVEEYAEIGEFLVYAGQSKDIWIKTRPDEERLAQGLRNSNFKEHAQTADYIEFTHGWPPDFWGPVAPFEQVYDPDTGQRHEDWRDDVWGLGRRTS